MINSNILNAKRTDLKPLLPVQKANHRNIAVAQSLQYSKCGTGDWVAPQAKIITGTTDYGVLNTLQSMRVEGETPMAKLPNMRYSTIHNNAVA